MNGIEIIPPQANFFRKCYSEGLTDTLFQGFPRGGGQCPPPLCEWNSHSPDSSPNEIEVANSRFLVFLESRNPKFDCCLEKVPNATFTTGICESARSCEDYPIFQSGSECGTDIRLIDIKDTSLLHLSNNALPG